MDSPSDRVHVAKLANGTATTSATFSEPGDYVLQAVVDDGSGESAGNFGYHCCWTNEQVKLTVKEAAPRATSSSHSAVGSQQSASVGCNLRVPTLK